MPPHRAAHCLARVSENSLWEPLQIDAVGVEFAFLIRLAPADNVSPLLELADIDVFRSLGPPRGVGVVHNPLRQTPARGHLASTRVRLIDWD